MMGEVLQGRRTKGLKKTEDLLMNKALINYRPTLGIEVLQDHSRPELGLFQNVKINGK